MNEQGLKALENLGAELGAAKAENEGLRGLLTTLRVSLNLDDTEYGLSQQEKRALAAEIDAALSQQPEPDCDWPTCECALQPERCRQCDPSPTDTFTAVDMATASAQGFRDGQAAVEPAPAQDEQHHVVIPPMVEFDDMVNRLFELDADARKYCARHWLLSMWKATLNRVCELNAARPAQTEQQPVARIGAVMSRKQRLFSIDILKPEFLDVGTELYATPIAQTAPQPEQSGLVTALEYYANGDHLLLADPDEWDTCSGEPANFLHDEAGTASVEDGSIAKVALEAYRAALSAQGQSNGDS